MSGLVEIVNQIKFSITMSPEQEPVQEFLSQQVRPLTVITIFHHSWYYIYQETIYISQFRPYAPSSFEYLLISERNLGNSLKNFFFLFWRMWFLETDIMWTAMTTTVRMIEGKISNPVSGLDGSVNIFLHKIMSHKYRNKLCVWPEECTGNLYSSFIWMNT